MLNNKQEEYDEEFHGGMYNLLKLIDKLLYKASEQWLTAKEVKSFCPNVSERAVNSNLARLVAAGLLEKIESRDPENHNFRQIRYKLNGEMINAIRRNLYN